MAQFRYKAVSASGETIQGHMEATSTAEVIARLQEAGNIPVSADEAGGGLGGGLLDMFQGVKRVKTKDIVSFTDQLSSLMAAGLPLDRALQILGDLADNEALGSMVNAVRDQVRGGSSLSDSLSAQHGVFSKLYINMVRAGESGGTLDVTLARLAEYQDRSQQLKATVVSALIYPAILLVLAVGAVMLLMMFVIPQFMPIFEDLGAELPLITKIVVGTATFISSFWWLILIAGFALFFWMASQLRNPVTRLGWDQRFLNIKLAGDLIAKMEMARLARTVGTLISNGVPLLSSLTIGRKVLNNSVMANAVGVAAQNVQTGGALGHALAETKLFPRLALQMINVGEETGKLDEMLLKVANNYDTEVKITIDRLMALFVPMLTLTLAGLIAVIVLSILMAMLGLNDLAG